MTVVWARGSSLMRGASSEDVRSLIEILRARVREAHGVQLETEVVFARKFAHRLRRLLKLLLAEVFGCLGHLIRHLGELFHLRGPDVVYANILEATKLASSHAF